MRCPVCKHPNAVEAPICTRCGTSLGASHAAGQAAPAAAPAPLREGERRQLTVLFCDVVDSTGLAERLELEELRDLLDEYHVACARVVERYEGYVAEYLGDGLVVYFSCPQAHENDPERAARAGLEILAAVHGLATKLRVRVAIHTGEVLVEEPEPGRHLALGHPLNLTARLKDLAEPDMLVMSATTERLVRGLFETDDLGPQDLKGIAGQIRAYRVLRPRRARNRIDIASEAGLTPLTGRDADLVRLRERWQLARRGEGQAMLVSGELGTGKSRLVRALRDDLAAEAPTWLECGGSPLHRDSAFQPLVELLRRHLALDDGDTPQQRLAVLERAMAETGLVPEAVVPPLAKLLSLPSDEDRMAAKLGPDVLRRRTFEALTTWLVSLAKQGPMVLLVEDLHWADPSTLELLELLIGALATAPVLLLATCRSYAAPAWEPSPQLTRHEVRPLSPEETATMVERVPGAADLSEKMRDEVVRRTDGVPLFVEELTKSLLEAGADEDVAIPTTLRDSLMARLDRLGDDKEVAQLGAILGREFSREEIAAVSTWEEGDLERGLTQLTAAELVYRSGAPGAVTYLFKHSLERPGATGTRG
jgi:class 3 adenylate cyclase